MQSNRVNSSLKAHNSVISDARIVRFVFLGLVTAITAFLRFSNLGLGPPGLNQDEAANAWNAYCLLKTGVDQVGQPWPIFYTRALGENRSTLFIYLLIPFQAMFGLSALSTRILAPVCGTLCIPLMYYVASRWFDRRVGLLAAALLAINPWHIQHSRWGHESSIVPFLVLLPIATMIWTGLPLADFKERASRAVSWRALLAGLLAGVACYGYPCVRLFLPAFLIVAIAVTWSRWSELWHLTRAGGNETVAKNQREAVSISIRSSPSIHRGRSAILLAFAGFAVTFGPLAIVHVVDPAINKRGEMTKVWRTQDGALERCAKVLERYAMHFDPAFLFWRGDAWDVFSPPGGGMFPWITLPLMLGGVARLTQHFMRRRLEPRPDGSDCALPRRAAHTGNQAPTNTGVVLLTVLLLTYPAGDVISGHPTAHALRALPGVIPLNILAAVGAILAYEFLRLKSRMLATAMAISCGLIACVEVGYDHARRIGEYNQRPRIYHDFFVDLLAACDFVRPRLHDYDVLFLSDAGMPYPYVVLLVGLEYDPLKWLNEPRDWEAGGWDTYRRFGKVRLLSQAGVSDELSQLRASPIATRALLIVRPGEFDQRQPLLEIKRPDGQVVLWVCEEMLGGK